MEREEFSKLMKDAREKQSIARLSKVHDFLYLIKSTIPRDQWNSMLLEYQNLADGIVKKIGDSIRRKEG